jgi:GH18 family chitinase
MKIKGEYVRKNSLGGAMFWELSGDDEKFSLLDALREGLGLSK